MTVLTVTVIIQNYTLTGKQSNKHILIVVISNFLSIYLEEAKSLYNGIKYEYKACLWDLMME